MKYTHEDGTPFTKEEFLQKLKTDKEFNNEFGNKGIDQISELIRQLKEEPDSRRMVVNAWVVHDLPKMTLPPCHYGFQVYTRELSSGERQAILEKIGYSGLLHSNVKNYKSHKKILEIIKQTCDDVNIPTRAISLMWNQRSVDTFLGLPFNIASYGLLLEIIAKEVNMVPDELIGNLGDTHLYLNHIEQAKEQIGRELNLDERAKLNPHPEMFYEIYGTFSINDNIENSNLPDEYKVWLHKRFDQEGVPTRTREPFPLPKLKIEDEVKWQEGDCLPYYSPNDFTLENYQSHPSIKAPLSN